MVDEIIADLRRANEEMLQAYREMAAEHERKLTAIRERIAELEKQEGRADGR